MTTRKYSSRSQQTTLSGALTNSGTSATVVSGTSLLGGATVAEVPELVNAPDRVVCCERDEYLRVVIYLPIGCSGLELDTEFVVSEFPR